MIAFVEGIVDIVSPEFVVINVNGIGYQVHCPNPFVFQHKEGKAVKIHTYQHVREDSITLYGFETINEKALFMKLIQVSGIGPKGGLAIVAAGQPEHIAQAIENEDERFLMKFPGVGKKTARQIILDLKGKLQDLLPDTLFNIEEDANAPASGAASQALEEAMEALKVLGYADREITKIIPALQKEELTATDEYVKRALQLLLKR